MSSGPGTIVYVPHRSSHPDEWNCCWTVVSPAPIHSSGILLKWQTQTFSERSILKVLSRLLRLRCPACGQASIAGSPFRLRHHCPNCRALFKREEGFFVGAILANVLTTEFVILAVCFVWLILIGSCSYESVLAGLIVVGLVFPVAFYHHTVGVSGWALTTW